METPDLTSPIYKNCPPPAPEDMNVEPSNESFPFSYSLEQKIVNQLDSLKSCLSSFIKDCQSSSLPSESTSSLPSEPSSESKTEIKEEYIDNLTDNHICKCLYLCGIDLVQCTYLIDFPESFIEKIHTKVIEEGLEKVYKDIRDNKIDLEIRKHILFYPIRDVSQVIHFIEEQKKQN